MSDINPSLPSIDELNSTADPKVRTALQTLIATINALEEANLADGAVSPDKVTAAFAAAIGLNQSGSVRRGSFTQASESAAYTATSYGDLSNGPDKVDSVVLPSNGLILVSYEAVWRATNGTPTIGFGYAGIHLGATWASAPQLKAHAGAVTAPQASEVTLAATGSTTATGDGILFTPPAGSSAYGAGLNTALGDSSAAVDNSVVTTGTIAGMIPIRAAAGTYDVGVKFKAGTGSSLYVKNRTLFVQAIGF